MNLDLEPDALVFGRRCSKTTIEDLVTFLKSKRLIIYPAGENARQLHKNLLSHGIRPEAFIDKNFDRMGAIDGIPVRSPEYIGESCSGSHVVAISANFGTTYDEIKSYLDRTAPQSLITNGRQLNRLLKSPVCTQKLDKHIPFDLIDCERCGFERDDCSIANEYLRTVGKYSGSGAIKKSSKFDWFGYIVSQKCTLRCEHCCEHVPYLNGKGFTSVEEILRDVETIAKSSEFIKFVELIGGEPLLHPKIEALLSGLLAIDNIGYIKSFTNGTIIPSDSLCEIMRNPRFMLQVSNYEYSTTGKLLDNILKTREKLDRMGIRYIHTRDFEWLDFTNFNHHDASVEYLEDAFEKCFLKNCHRVYKGVLYRCPHQYAGHQTGAIEVPEGELVHIHAPGDEMLGTVLENFENLTYIDACSKCELAFSPKPVPAGLQLPVKVTKKPSIQVRSSP